MVELKWTSISKPEQCCRNVPGLAIGHPAILYDNVTDLYWMASNMNRDSTRRWRQPWQKEMKKLHITPFSKCEVRAGTSRISLYHLVCPLILDTKTVVWKKGSMLNTLHITPSSGARCAAAGFHILGALNKAAKQVFAHQRVALTAASEPFQAFW